MPLFDYECIACNAAETAFRSVANRNRAPKCGKCGGRTKKVISHAAAIGDMEPYFDENLETYIQSRQHRARVMREKDVYEKVGNGWY